MTRVICSLIFLLSASGYFLLLNRRYRVAMEFVPALYCSICVSVLFAAGILNFLLEGVLAFTIAGIICFYRYAGQISNISKREWGILGIFGVIAVYFFAALYNNPLKMDDDLAHWGVVVTQMLRSNRMPNIDDTLVNFRSYPLGSALWIYYVSRVSGGSEGIYAISHQVMQASFLLTTLAHVRKENRYLIFLPAGYFLFSTVADVPIDNLRVDSLMAVAAVAAFSIVAYYREQPGKAVWCSAPVLITLMQIKNSAVFFGAVFLLWSAWYQRKSLLLSKSALRQFLLGNVVMPFGGLLIWMRHVSMVFGDGIAGKHAVSLKNYSYILGEKSWEDIQYILRNGIRTAFDLNNGTFWGLIVLTIGLLILIPVLREKKPWKVLAMVGANWVVFATYFAGVCAMYIFSMPLSEAKILGSFDRYLYSCGIFLYGVNGIWLLLNLSHEKMSRRVVPAALCLGMVVLPFWNITQGVYRFPEETKRLVVWKRDQLTELEIIRKSIDEYGELMEDARYAVYEGPDGHGSLFFVIQYATGSDAVAVLNGEASLDGGLQRLSADYDYLFIWNPDQASDEMLAAGGYESLCQTQGALINLMGLRNEGAQ